MTREHGIKNTVAGGSTGRAKRDAEHRERVEAIKRGLRESMADPGRGYVYGEEWFREHTRLGNFAEADAIQELLPEIREHNERVEGGTKAQAERLRREAVKADYEERQKRGEERAKREAEVFRRGKAHKDSRLGAATREKEEARNAPKNVAPTARGFVKGKGYRGPVPTLPPMGAA